jgi:16S rRNA (guanine966-N2)-methyltransferase
MRVIAGRARSLPLKTIEGLDTRPTTDRIKETLFNMLQTKIPGCVFLDLFSGSGAIGIEAISRGAAKAYFVENAPKAAACIRENLAFTKLEEQATLMECDAVTAVRRLSGKEVFDIIFMDPPYNRSLEQQVLEQLKNSTIADEYTTIIFEASLDTDISFVEEMGYTLEKVKKYKTNMHIFLHK